MMTQHGTLTNSLPKSYGQLCVGDDKIASKGPSGPLNPTAHITLRRNLLSIALLLQTWSYDQRTLKGVTSIGYGAQVSDGEDGAGPGLRGK